MITKVREGYKAFGLNISSEIPFPELLRMNDLQVCNDVEVVIDPSFKEAFNLSPYEVIVDGEAVTMRLPDAGVFSIQNGNKIIVSPCAEADEDVIRLYLLGTCMGIILIQRSIYPLHGSAVVINGNAYAFIGESGAGKSTLASAFVGRGHKLVTDDIVPISFLPAEHRPIVTPSYPQQKLWQQSLDAFGMNNAELRSIHGRETKFCISVEDKYYTDPIPLAGIFLLEKSDVDGINIQAVKKLERLPLLFQHTYRHFLIPKMNLMSWHFGFSSKLGERLPIYHLRRSENGFSAPQLVDLILKTISLEE
ncbi:aldolase [Paenibacillus sp. 2TAB26]|uniref:aldolase n=1 Tax=Paenibacillus sp. 2TAB26 TaxID=3233005 RepID=UPI003F96F4AC